MGAARTLAMIAIVDYDAGNLTSVAAAVEALGFDAVITSDPGEIAAAERIIFPGVGAAGSAMRNLRRLGLAGPLRQAVTDGKPFLGICLGFQILFEHSDEDGGVDLLGVFPGRVVRFADGMREGDQGPLKVPHMGWNQVAFRGRHPVWQEVPPGAEFYFVHSYYPQPAATHVCAETTYGTRFASGVAQGSVVAFQFHPEKSGRPGLQLLRSFLTWFPA
jgi:glutamine amidotransferase